MPLTELPEATALVKAHLVHEVAACFPRLTRIPSSGTISFCDYFATLAVPDRQALLDALARSGALQFIPPRDAYDALLNLRAESPALQRYQVAMMSAHYTMGMRHQSLGMIKATLTDPTSVAMMAQTRPRAATPQAHRPRFQIRIRRHQTEASWRRQHLCRHMRRHTGQHRNPFREP